MLANRKEKEELGENIIIIEDPRPPKVKADIHSIGGSNQDDDVT